MYNDGGGLPCMNHQTILTIEILFEKLTVYTLKSDVFLWNDPFSFWDKKKLSFQNLKMHGFLTGMNSLVLGRARLTSVKELPFCWKKRIWRRPSMPSSKLSTCHLPWRGTLLRAFQLNFFLRSSSQRMQCYRKGSLCFEKGWTKMEL